MLYCKNCRVRLPGKYDRCPLCQRDLTGHAEESGNVFPIISSPKSTHRSILAWLAFASVAASAICAAINLVLPEGGWWFLFVAGGIGSFWITLAVVLKKGKNIPKTILWQVILLSILTYSWDLLTGFHGWSLNYVLPILTTCAMVAIFAIAKARRLDIQDYIFSLILVSVFGLLSFILLILDRISVVIPTAICFASSIIFLASLLSFESKALIAEMQRRFHL